MPFRAIFVALMISAMMSAACGGTSEPEVPATYEPGPGAFEAASEDADWHDAARDRIVPVRIFAPEVVAGDGPFPAVVFSHGLGESREAFDYLGTYWAEHGYLVVFITHVGHDAEAIREAIRNGDFSAFGDPESAPERTGDMSFVLDRLLSEDPGSELLSDRVDPDRVGAAGQCAGSSTALAIAGLTILMPDDPATSFRDDRARVAVALSPQVPGGGMEAFLHGGSWDTVATPALVVTGSEDFQWVPQVRADPAFLQLPYDRIPVEEKYLGHILGAEHHAFTDSAPWYPAGERDPRHHGWIQQITTAFLEGHLRDNQAAITWLDDKKLEASTAGEIQQTPLEPAEGTLYKPEPGPYPVAVVETVVLRDAARDKDVPVRITYPDTLGPFPVIFFSHCMQCTKDLYPVLVRYWVSHGYVCIQPDHDDSPNVGDMTREEALSTWRTRPPDVTFLIDSLADIEALAPGVAGKMDPDRIGAGGHYIGAGTSNLLVGTRMYPDGPDAAPAVFDDPRVDASLAFSPTGTGQGLLETSWDLVDRPMLVMTGSDDPSNRTDNPPEWRTDPYTYAPPGDKYLVWIEGLDSSYGGLVAQPVTDSAIADYIRTVSLAFFDAHLKDTSAALQNLKSGELDRASEGIVEVTSK